MQIRFLAMAELCLTGYLEDLSIKLEKCDELSLNQKWEFGTFNLTALQNWEKSGRSLENGISWQ